MLVWNVGEVVAVEEGAGDTVGTVATVPSMFVEDGVRDMGEREGSGSSGQVAGDCSRGRDGSRFGVEKKRSWDGAVEDTEGVGVGFEVNVPKAEAARRDIGGMLSVEDNSEVRRRCEKEEGVAVVGEPESKASVSEFGHGE